jgi:ubiquinone/menaquinone biosynthesis C-methylase UbiE
MNKFITNFLRPVLRTLLPNYPTLLAKWQFRKYGLDFEFKKKFARGERFSLGEIEGLYDKTWGSFHNDCVGGQDLDLLLDAASEVGGTALDVGCGQGKVAIALAKRGLLVTGADISGVALDVAHNNARREGLEISWIRSAAEDLPLDDKSFDVVTCSHTLEHVQDVRAVAEELRRVAKKRIIIIVPQESEMDTLSTDYHIQFFPTADDLVKALPFSPTFVSENKVVSEQWHGKFIFLVADLAQVV